MYTTASFSKAFMQENFPCSYLLKVLKPHKLLCGSFERGIFGKGVKELLRKALKRKMLLKIIFTIFLLHPQIARILFASVVM